MLDAAVARIFRMPPGRHDYTLTEAERVPMRDGVELLTDVYAPVEEARGTVLMRTRYEPRPGSAGDLRCGERPISGTRRGR
jgi:predicted acyl esterase